LSGSTFWQTVVQKYGLLGVKMHPHFDQTAIPTKIQFLIYYTS